MSNPTDKASVAIDEIEARHNYLTDKVDAGYQFGCMNGHHAHEDRRRLLAEVNRLRTLSPAQGDGMRDALVRAREVIDTLYMVGNFDNGVTDSTGMIDEGSAKAAGLIAHTFEQIDAALASHPDRQPGMTGEDVERVAKAMWDRTHDEPWPGDPGDIAPQIYRDDARTAIAAIKRASQRQ